MNSRENLLSQINVLGTLHCANILSPSPNPETKGLLLAHFTGEEVETLWKASMWSNHNSNPKFFTVFAILQYKDSKDLCISTPTFS
jgi:hypothetical protein